MEIFAHFLRTWTNLHLCLGSPLKNNSPALCQLPGNMSSIPWVDWHPTSSTPFSQRLNNSLFISCQETWAAIPWVDWHPTSSTPFSWRLNNSLFISCQETWAAIPWVDWHPTSSTPFSWRLNNSLFISCQETWAAIPWVDWHPTSSTPFSWRRARWPAVPAATPPAPCTHCRQVRTAGNCGQHQSGNKKPTFDLFVVSFTTWSQGGEGLVFGGWHCICMDLRIICWKMDAYDDFHLTAGNIWVWAGKEK